jgi:hypothetical protein
VSIYSDPQGGLELPLAIPWRPPARQ